MRSKNGGQRLLWLRLISLFLWQGSINQMRLFPCQCVWAVYVELAETISPQSVLKLPG